MDNLYYQPPEPPKPFPFDKKELIFAPLLCIACLLAVNFTFFGGFHLGFAIGAVLCILVGLFYLLACGARPGAYPLTILALCLVIAAGFGRSNDGFVKFVLAQFLFLGVNLSFSLLSGKNRFAPGRFSSLGDSFAAFFGLGFGKLSPAFRGLVESLRQSGKLGRGMGSVLLGLCIALPILLLVVPLLASADAAFDGLVSLLPQFNLEELLTTLVFGEFLFCLLFSRNTGLVYSQAEPSAQKHSRGLSAVTVITVLSAVCVVYLAYLLSQLAYFAGGFSGLLPEEYTLAEYARRGFFEMAALCGINLGIIALCLAIVKKEGTAPLAVRVLCLFVGLVTLFFVAAASAKMFLYIESYGLTQLRLLTQIVMLFLAITTGAVCLWLFIPRLPYMKVVILAALIIGAVVIWADVDSTVADYNVDAYLSGRLQHIDVWHLGDLGTGAVPHIVRLREEATDPDVIRVANTVLSERSLPQWDLRSWNWSVQQAFNSLSK